MRRRAIALLIGSWLILGNGGASTLWPLNPMKNLPSDEACLSVRSENAVEVVEMPLAKTESNLSLVVDVTAYCYTGKRTASGTWPKHGTIAADPRVLPFGTKVYIPGYGEGVVEDTGRLIKGNRIDVYIPSYDACIEWGIKEMEVELRG